VHVLGGVYRFNGDVCKAFWEGQNCMQRSGRSDGYLLAFCRFLWIYLLVFFMWIGRCDGNVSNVAIGAIIRLDKKE
jgi:hypothetical protein